MEDDLNIFENGRRPQLFLKMEDDQKKLINGRQPIFLENGRQHKLIIFF